MSLLSLINVVKAVEEAKTRLTGYKQSFFSEYDLWTYHAKWSDPTEPCIVCKELGFSAGVASVWSGVHLRKYFPYLTIADANRINVNQHPNCRCWLQRITDPRAYIDALDHLRLE